MSICGIVSRPRKPCVDARTRQLLQDPIAPALIRLAIPSTLVIVAQLLAGLLETWLVSRLGTQALAAMALVFPVLMLCQMMSSGAMGGGISSSIARALGDRKSTRLNSSH